ncbi:MULTISPECIES: DNA repair protein RecO [Exiguobacterium]|uniref:DNA repair protein RecO n=1 Tax=Exiguobacterium oxidotolerans TaxID=223958 RepID=A0A653IFV8_9BACL|nr:MULTISPECIES: DNA repair protein RecO [Exiguobacterium]ASI34788.1 DNA repair protein RecO [Exiguobacterium sp. N4-1P]VWX38035.1 DNA double strand break repair and homologous recombination factor [Exiguobacterium oxidotolerans]
MIDKAEGLVLRTVVYGESNKIITLLTREYGKLAVMARGAKKPGSRFNAASQPFIRAVYVYPRSRGLGQLKSADVITGYSHIRQDVLLMSYAMYLLELADKALDERVAYPTLYDLFVDGLEAMDEGLDPDVVSFIVELRLLRHLGIAPHLNGCTICGSTEAPFAFSLNHGGLLCKRHRHEDEYAVFLQESVAKMLYVFSVYDFSRIGTVTVKPETKRLLRQIMDAYMERYSGLRLRSKRVLDQLLNLEND